MARLSQCTTASCRSLIIRSFRLSAAMALAQIFGLPAYACSMRLLRSATASSARFTGWKCTQVNLRSASSVIGCAQETVDAFSEFLVGIKGPLTTPVGKGIRSLNVALRQMLDLYVCPAPGEILRRRPLPRQAPGEGGYGDLPRKTPKISTRASTSKQAAKTR